MRRQEPGLLLTLQNDNPSVHVTGAGGGRYFWVAANTPDMTAGAFIKLRCD